MKTVVVVPSIKLDLAKSIVNQLREQNEFDAFYLFDNSRDQHISKHFSNQSLSNMTVVPAPGMTIYQMWNMGWGLSLLLDSEVNLAILNDDLTLPAKFLSRLAYALRFRGVGLVYPDYELPMALDRGTVDALVPTIGTYKDFGMCGWAFMVRAELRANDTLPPIDEQFEWWCGDDDLARQLMLSGWIQAKVLGVGFEHIGEASSRDRPEVELMKGPDIERFKQKYGDW